MTRRRVPVRDGQTCTLIVKEVLLRRHTPVASATDAPFVEPAMNRNVFSPLRGLAAPLVVCLFAGTVSAQIAPPLPDPSSPPVAGVDAGTPAEPPGGQP